MIRYQRGGPNFFLKAFQMYGSVFPVAGRVALPCSLLALTLRLCVEHWGSSSGSDKLIFELILQDSAVWNGFSLLVGFLVVFRTSQAYARFWEGCSSVTVMRAEWLNAANALISFCRTSRAGDEAVSSFQLLLIRLFSMLHAVACAEIEDSNSDDVEEVYAYKFELIDAQGIDADSLKQVRDSSTKVELVLGWIHNLIADSVVNGVLAAPAPILSRAWQELATGMVAFQEAIKISTIPFPFPYAQTCDVLLMVHWLVCPVVAAQWVHNPAWAMIFTFIQAFFLWSMNEIATEIENPFGMDANDIDMETLHKELNEHLFLMVTTQGQRVPRLAMPPPEDSRQDHDWEQRTAMNRDSFMDIWSGWQRSGTVRTYRIALRRQSTVRMGSKDPSPSGKAVGLPSQCLSAHFGPSPVSSLTLDCYHPETSPNASRRSPYCYGASPASSAFLDSCHSSVQMGTLNFTTVTESREATAEALTVPAGAAEHGHWQAGPQGGPQGPLQFTARAGASKSRSFDSKPSQSELTVQKVPSGGDSQFGGAGGIADEACGRSPAAAIRVSSIKAEASGSGVRNLLPVILGMKSL